MPVRLKCPSCGVFLTVSDAAPAMLTCPKCLAKIRNDAAHQVPMPLAPLRVLPLDEQVARDSKFSASVAIPVVVMVIIGVGLLVIGGSGHATGFSAVMILAAMGLLVLAAVMSAQAMLGPKPKIDQPPQPTGVSGGMPYQDSGSRVLNYRTAPASSAQGCHSAGMWIQASVGVILGLAVMIAAAIWGTLMLWWLIPIGGLALIFVPNVRGLGFGLLMAFPVALLLALGLCAALIMNK